MNRAKALLEGGRTERFHATPHHLPYSVAQHSWGMAALLEAFWPDAPARLLKACLFHDVAERWTGDMPAPGKWWLCPEANAHLKAAEAQITRQLQVDYERGLDGELTNWLKALDLLELLLFCMDELHMGNMNVKQTVRTCREHLLEKWVPQEIQAFVTNLNWERCDDFAGHQSATDEGQKLGLGEV